MLSDSVLHAANGTKGKIVVSDVVMSTKAK